jgi:hypothetical protein
MVAGCWSLAAGSVTRLIDRGVLQKHCFDGTPSEAPEPGTKLTERLIVVASAGVARARSASAALVV